MRRVKDYLKELNREKLIETYFEYAPDGNEGLFNLQDYTVAQKTEIMHREIDKFIQGLIDMEIAEIPDGNTYILIAYPGQVTTTEIVDVKYSLISKEDLFNEDKEVKIHYFDTSPLSEIIGLFVADTPYTQANIYDLMAQVIYEALNYGFQQERMKDENPEFDNPFGIWHRDSDKYFEELECRLLESVPLESTQHVDFEQMRLWMEVHAQLRKYYNYCKNRELNALRDILNKENNIKQADNA